MIYWNSTLVSQNPLFILLHTIQLLVELLPMILSYVYIPIKALIHTQIWKTKVIDISSMHSYLITILIYEPNFHVSGILYLTVFADIASLHIWHLS